ncbi:MAG: hypothetical protein ABI836_14795 [Gemmatimonadota bacterium]
MTKIVYLVLPYYNITSLNPADYAGVRPELRPTSWIWPDAFTA